METTDIKQLFASLVEAFSQNATIKKVYGEPIETQGKTIIPVARVAMGFGGGFGAKKGTAATENNPNKPMGEGGLGGGIMAKPIGIIEITPTQTRFIRFNISRYIALGAIAGFAVSRISQRTHRKHQYPAL